MNTELTPEEKEELSSTTALIFECLKINKIPQDTAVRSMLIISILLLKKNGTSLENTVGFLSALTKAFFEKDTHER